MDKLGLDNYATLFYKLNILWISMLSICGGTGIWWSTLDLNALSIPIIEFFSIAALLICNKCIHKYFLNSNSPIKLSVITIAVVLLANLALAIWVAVIFEDTAVVITNLVVLWLSSALMICSFLCLALPLAVVFWNMRSEDLAKAQNIGGKMVAPAPLSASSRQEEPIQVTLK